MRSAGTSAGSLTDANRTAPAVGSRYRATAPYDSRTFRPTDSPNDSAPVTGSRS